jgi:hypothetical protein
MRTAAADQVGCSISTRNNVSSSPDITCVRKSPQVPHNNLFGTTVVSLLHWLQRTTRSAASIINSAFSAIVFAVASG